MFISSRIFLIDVGAIVELDNGDVAHEEVAATESDVVVMGSNNNNLMDDEADDDDEGDLVIGDAYNETRHRADHVSVLTIYGIYESMSSPPKNLPRIANGRMNRQTNATLYWDAKSCLVVRLSLSKCILKSIQYQQ